MTEKERKKKLKESNDILLKATKELNKMFKRTDNIIGSAEEKIKAGRRITTSYPSLDKILGGGLPLGCIVELYGPEGSGKGVLSMKIVAEAQKEGLISLWVDAENQLNKAWMTVNGIVPEDEDTLKIMSCDSGETAETILETVLKLINTGALSVVVVDSVAALIPEAELTRNIGDRKVGALATTMADGLRKIMQAVKRAECTCIFINQTREKIGVMYGNPETTPGGKSLGFFSSIRMRINALTKADKQIKKDGDLIGRMSKVKTTKNRFEQPNQEALVEIYFKEYAPNALDILAESAMGLKLITKRMGVFKFRELKNDSLSTLMESVEFNGLMGEFGAAVQEALTNNIEYELNGHGQKCLDSILDGTFKLEDYREM